VRTTTPPPPSGIPSGSLSRGSSTMVRPLMASRDGVRRAAWWHPPITSSRFRARLVVRCVGRDVWPHAPSLFPGYGHAPQPLGSFGHAPQPLGSFGHVLTLSAPLAMHQPLRSFGHASASPLLWPCTSLSATLAMHQPLRYFGHAPASPPPQEPCLWSRRMRDHVHLALVVGGTHAVVARARTALNANVRASLVCWPRPCASQ